MSDSKPINTGGPAFPHGPLGDSITFEDGHTRHQMDGCGGMTLRDYFAANVLRGKAGWRSLKTVEEQEAAALECYSMADAMISERNNPSCRRE